MKRIIDIPERLYESLKERTANHVDNLALIGNYQKSYMFMSKEHKNDNT